MPDADDLFRAFADPTRRRLLHLVGLREWCVGDLVEIVGAPQPTVSRHLAHLRSCGAVRVRHDATWNHYRAAAKPGPVLAALYESLRRAAAEAPIHRADRARAEALLREGGCCPERARLAFDDANGSLDARSDATPDATPDAARDGSPEEAPA